MQSCATPSFSMKRAIKAPTVFLLMLVAFPLLLRGHRFRLCYGLLWTLLSWPE